MPDRSPIPAAALDALSDAIEGGDPVHILTACAEALTRAGRAPLTEAEALARAVAELDAAGLPEVAAGLRRDSGEPSDLRANVRDLLTWDTSPEALAALCAIVCVRAGYTVTPPAPPVQTAEQPGSPGGG